MKKSDRILKEVHRVASPDNYFLLEAIAAVLILCAFFIWRSYN
ncbi:MAG: hypothetical protein AB9834_01315 [Lentimicrobium sp.]